MLARLRPRLNHATVVAYLALFVALGGSAWAVAANSVGTKELKDNAVTTPKIANGAVTNLKLADGAAAKSLKIRVYTKAVDIPAGKGNGGTASCPTGQRAVAGGGLADNVNDGFMESTRPVRAPNTLPSSGETFNAWRAYWHTLKGNITLHSTVYVICIS